MSTATPTIAPARGNPLRRLLKWLGLALLALLVLLALGLWWLLGSAAGARFALARASAATDGKLTLAVTDPVLVQIYEVKRPPAILSPVN